MKYIYKEKQKDAPVFVLLHGTGGNEKDLLPLAEKFNPNYNQLAIRGNVKENGMNRFFKRHAEGKYDWKDLEFRAQELYGFIQKKAEEYQFKLDNLILVGFSNGSNIAIKLMLEKPEIFKQAILFAPMYPKNVNEIQDFTESNVFLSLGINDPIVKKSESQRVIDLFQKRGAHVTTIWGEGHHIHPEALKKASDWLES